LSTAWPVGTLHSTTKKRIRQIHRALEQRKKTSQRDQKKEKASGKERKKRSRVQGKRNNEVVYSLTEDHALKSIVEELVDLLEVQELEESKDDDTELISNFPEFQTIACNICSDLDPIHKQIASLIASGAKLWDENKKHPTLRLLKRKFCQISLAQASNTHPAERAVKEAKLVSQTGKREEMRSVVAICRSYLLPECDKLKGKEKAQRTLELVCAQHSRLTDHDGTNKAANTSPRRAHVLVALKGGGHFRKTRMKKKKTRS
jgi:hypothetical protein